MERTTNTLEMTCTEGKQTERKTTRKRLGVVIFDPVKRWRPSLPDWKHLAMWHTLDKMHEQRGESGGLKNV